MVRRMDADAKVKQARDKVDKGTRSSMMEHLKN